MGRRKISAPENARGKKHLTQNDRITIQTMLDRNKSPYQIAKALGKSSSTITREIQKHARTIPEINDCQNYQLCLKERVCYGKRCTRLCKNCRSNLCRKKCHDYVRGSCDELPMSPHVCNGCEFVDRCALEKKLYNADIAHKNYLSELKGKRDGFDLTDEEIRKIDELVSPMIKQGHSPYAVIQAIGNELPCSESTLYRLIDSCALDTRNIDLNAKVKRKPRKTNRHRNKDAQAKITKAKQGHLWEDYLKYLEKHSAAVQMDCVEGLKAESAVVLSLHWPKEHMQLYFIMDVQDCEHVVSQLDIIEESLGYELFCEMFPAILTDNGSEFADVCGIERSATMPGQNRTKVFYCEPNRSDEKGHCESNHRFFRRVLPKGTSLEPYDQFDMNLLTNHVNSYIRRELGGICPYDEAMETYKEDFFVLLGLERIPAQKVILTPKLLRKPKTA